MEPSSNFHQVSCLSREEIVVRIGGIGRRKDTSTCAVTYDLYVLVHEKRSGSVVDVLVASVVSRLRRVEDEVRHSEAKTMGVAT